MLFNSFLVLICFSPLLLRLTVVWAAVTWTFLLRLCTLHSADLVTIDPIVNSYHIFITTLLLVDAFSHNKNIYWQWIFKKISGLDIYHHPMPSWPWWILGKYLQLFWCDDFVEYFGATVFQLVEYLLCLQWSLSGPGLFFVGRLYHCVTNVIAPCESMQVVRIILVSLWVICVHF